MGQPGRAPGGIDVTRPNFARMYDYFLGGKDNYAADREAADGLVTVVPDLGAQARANREFLGRAVRFLAGAGIRQFIDVGAGLPTQGNVHEIARETAPEARVAYVDYDPVVLAHGRALLEHTEGVEVIHADARDPASILQHPDVRNLVDFDQPFALMLVAILHFVADDDDPAGIVATFRDAMAPGSYVAISQGTTENRPTIGRGAEMLGGATASVTPRTRAELTGFFGGFDLVPPGIVDVRVWGTQVREEPTDTVIYAGVGRKPFG